MISYSLGAFLIFSMALFLISFIQKQKRLNRLDNITLHQKLMASTLKSPDERPFYF